MVRIFGKFRSALTGNFKIKFRMVKPSHTVFAFAGYCSSSNLKHISILKKFTDCTEENVIKALKKWPLNYLDENDLKLRLRTLLKCSIHNVKSIYSIALLRFQPIVVKNRVTILREVGVNRKFITPMVLVQFANLLIVNIKNLKELSIIDHNINVVKNIFQHLDLGMECYPSFLDDSYSIFDIRNVMLRIYLKNRLDMPEEAFTEPLMKRVLNKSFTTIRRNVDISLNVIGMTKKKVCGNPFLLSLNTDNALDIITGAKKVCGIDVTKLLEKCPKILCNSLENLLQIEYQLKSFGFCDASILSRKEIFTLSSVTIEKRLRGLQKDPYFSICLKHPRGVQLLYFHEKAKKRKALLDEIKMSYANLNTLFAGEPLFQRFYETGRETGGQDILVYLSAELECHKLELKRKLQRLQFWSFVPILQISETYTFLSKTFSKKELLENIFIIFYPRIKVERELNLLEMKEGLECCKENGVIKRSLILPLIIYFMEKEVNFSGEGIWDNEAESHNSDQLHEMRTRSYHIAR